MVSENGGPDSDQEPKLFALFRKAWLDAEGDDFEHNMVRQSLRASAPAFADRMDRRERLIDLLWKAPEADLAFRATTEEVADYLIANGVTVSETALALGEASNSVANAWTDAVSAIEEAEAMSAVRATLPPEGLCGAIHENPTATSPAWGHCVFLPNHKGKHSWQK